MSTRPFPAAKNYSDLALARHRIERVVKDINLELTQMQWVIEGTRHPDDLNGHRATLRALISDLRQAIRKEAEVEMEHYPTLNK